MADYHEAKFEAELCEHLAAHGWLYDPGDGDRYDKARALYPDDIWAWLEETQPDELAKVASRDQLLDRIVKVLDGPLETTGGTLNLLRRGFATGAASFAMVQARPETDLNPETGRRYAANRVRVMRQVRYSQHNGNALDLVFFVNGLPVATVELKTDFTQTSGLAVEQYKRDRTPRDPATNKIEPLLRFGHRALVHFAVSNTDAQMTTHLRGADTHFLPFNTGNAGGAGNPANPDGSPTSYLWERVWQRDNWLRILLSFMHLHVETKTHPITGETKRSESLLFPRYHQWEAVTALVADARVQGAGKRYLVQHSAGSGKSNSIAWLTHQLATLHDAAGEKVFRSVIVVTDRNVLDSQLRETIKSVDHRAGVVVSIGDDTAGGRSKSQQLAEALTSLAPIITVTIQTFPFVGQALADAGLEGERFAIIADEAHSSQTGVAAAEIKKVLSAGERADLDDGGGVGTEDLLAWQMAQRADNPNISYFAFTATPKNRTLELFGTPDADGRPRPFHLYTMRQAIEEGFILDVLDNYTPYDTAFRLRQRLKSADAPEREVDQSQATKELMRWVRLHPTNVSQKVRIIVDHFRSHVRGHLGGHAKAMVVTGSRKEAVRYKLAMDAYIDDNGYDDVATLVAFSGSVEDQESGPEPFTEASMNPGLRGRTLPRAFAGPEFDVLIVANKFQTGFDQPLLVAMYVDKRLDGVTAVQTLSRLNRITPGKDATYVVDFVNDPDDIVAAFKPYYEEASLSATTDPDLIHDLRAKLDAAHIYTDEEVEAVARAWVRDSGAPKAHERLQALLAEPRVRFTAALDHALAQDDRGELERLELFRKDVDTYVKLYDFLSQVINYGQTDLEKRAIFFRLFARLIRDESRHETVDLSDVVLANVAHREGATVRLDLATGQPVELDPLRGAGSGLAQDPVLVALAEVIRRMNEVFDGGSFDDTDIGALSSHVVRRMLDNPVVRTQVRTNTQQQVAESPTLKAGFTDALVEAQAAYGELVKQLFDADSKRTDYFHSLITLLYETARAGDTA
ncbi:type I restriction endonuclease subunit R [Nocardioides sp.]|uniref:type I restriction endonuclease subunit R n=1 Tax=Nocardioides sp. TaxID=35761 RepID=UPI002EDA4205